MKWIGQHIWDFISRFRSDVYLEGTDSGTIASGGNLGLDSNNKVVKSASPSGSIDLTSEVTGTLPVANGGTGATSLTDNSVLTGTGTSPITAESNLPFIGSLLNLTGACIIRRGASAGVPALDINNTDIAQIAIDIDANNTTVPVIDITANNITTASMTDFNLTTSTTGAYSNLSGPKGVFGDWDLIKTGDTGDGITFEAAGLSIKMDDQATSNHANSVVTQYGAIFTVDSAGTDGTIKNVGLQLEVTDGDYNTGLVCIVEDGGDHLSLHSSSDTGDKCTVSVAQHGATTITTVDDDATAANLTFNIDGNITLTTPDEHYSTSIDRRKFSITSSTDHDHNGDVVYFGGGSTTKGNICYLRTDATWADAQADDTNTSTQLLAVALGTDPDTDGMLLRGMITLDHDVGNNQGVTLYLSDGTGGQATTTAPSDTDDVVRIIGYNMGDDDQIWFCPDNTWVEIA